MKKYIQKIKDSINKSWNNKASKTKRLIIYGLLLAYMGVALYVIFMPAPDYRYEEYVRSHQSDYRGGGNSCRQPLG